MKYAKKYYYQLTLLSLISALCCVVLLLGFTIYVPISQTEELNIEQQTLLQIARANTIAKDMIILTYNQSRDNTQFVDELQITLPILAEAQMGFLEGDAKLGIPGNPSDIVQRAVLATQNDYLSIASAARVVLSQPDKVLSTIETNIVLVNTDSYTTRMQNLLVVLRQEAGNKTTYLLIIKSALDISLIAFFTKTIMVVKKREKKIQEIWG